MQRKTYTGLITTLNKNQYFCFGSNKHGIHKAGTALIALNKFGAIYGQSHGLQGQSYAICTKDITKNIHPSVSESDIINQIIELYKYAENNPNSEFFIAYTGSGVNLNYYTALDMAKMFNRPHIPINIIFEDNFLKLIKTINNE